MCTATIMTLLFVCLVLVGKGTGDAEQHKSGMRRCVFCFARRWDSCFCALGFDLMEGGPG